MNINKAIDKRFLSNRFYIDVLWVVFTPQFAAETISAISTLDFNSHFCLLLPSSSPWMSVNTSQTTESGQGERLCSIFSLHVFGASFHLPVNCYFHHFVLNILLIVSALVIFCFLFAFCAFVCWIILIFRTLWTSFLTPSRHDYSSPACVKFAGACVCLDVFCAVTVSLWLVSTK